MPKPTRMHVSQETLHELLDYNQRSGELTWRKTRAVTAKAGDIAGTERSDGHIAITIKGRQYMAARIIWLYMTGQRPQGLLSYRDNDPKNLRWRNIAPLADIAAITPGAAYQRRRRAIARARLNDSPAELDLALNKHDPRDPRDPRNTTLYVAPKRRFRRRPATGPAQ